MSNSQDLFNAHSEADLRSGLRSSEIDGESQLSYTDLSSVEPNSTTFRPGVNDDFGTTERSGQASDMTHQVIYGTDINVRRLMDSFKTFFEEFKAKESDEILITIQYDPEMPLYLQKLQEMNTLQKTWINVDCAHLESFNNSLYHNLLCYPKEVIPAMDCVLNNLFAPIAKTKGVPIQIRPYNCEKSRHLRNLNPEDLDQLVTVSGLVIRMSGVISDMSKGHFKCSVCDQTVMNPCERGRIIQPDTCTNCNSNHTMAVIHNASEFTDKQMLKLQESPDDMPAGETPHTVTLYCYQELVDTIQPGDRVTVTGIYRSAPQKENSRQRIIKSVFNTYLDVLHFQKSANRLRDDVEQTSMSAERIAKIKKLSLKPDLYDRLSSAIAPSIYGNETIKKGILLMLFGGVKKSQKEKGCGDDTRPNIHILLCGDPGTSKSQLLQYIYNLTPRSQYTSGKGSSKVGLTAYVTRDPESKNPTLESGALALADNGVCCIDEFDKMSESTRSILHEVMEQQSLSIAKAGIICQLHARTSILAGANPIGSKWDPKKTIIDNIQLSPTLLSRFDLIFLMLDPQDEVYDARLARHLIGLFQKSTDNTIAADNEEDGSVSYDLLRDYIAYAKDTAHPVLSKQAQKHLIEEYVAARKVGQGIKGQISAYPRQLESLIRLSEAHARMRLSEVVTVEDCLEARRLQREALKQAAVDPLTGLIDVNILMTGVSGGLQKKKEDMAKAIYAFMETRRVASFNYQKLLDDVRAQCDRMITRDLFEDGLNFLKMENKIDWSGKTIKKR